MERTDTMPDLVDRDAGQWHREVADRASLPTPPSMHWGWVFLLSVVTLGIFAIVWSFIQANWVRRIDPDSRATAMMGAALTCYFVGYFLAANGAPLDEDAPATTMERLGWLLELVYVLLFLGAYFAMAGTIRRVMAGYRVPMRIGGITLFFFNTLYLQGQLTWLARWQQTGQSRSRPPKLVFWLVMVVPFAAIVLAIAGPAYQAYVMRAQVASALLQAEPLKQQVLDAIGRNRAWPQDNSEAGLKEAGAYASANLAGFEVQAMEEGTALVTTFGGNAPAPLRGRQLAFIAEGHDGVISWTCESPDIDPSYLPAECR
ncbi:pilin [Frateuria sp. MAH-13]|uniref:Pilin n=1 Tax=Frateuria flava TaxID=2821489 RepID=A0ABS4DLJ5_9GAMM|nr:pilin [Frateuria flava]MBP1473932.1 pilin [Frateuria flava]